MMWLAENSGKIDILQFFGGFFCDPSQTHPDPEDPTRNGVRWMASIVCRLCDDGVVSWRIALR